MRPNHVPTQNNRVSQSGLSPDDIRNAYPEFTRLLILRKNQLLSLIESARKNLDEQVMTSPGDDADMSVIDASADFFLEQANGYQRELTEIRDALDRMHRGIYGICANCEEPIAFDRLKNLPYARLCIDCQSTREKHAAAAYPRNKPTL